MKSPLSIFLALACVGLLVAFAVVKHNDNAQHEADAGTINDVSNQLGSAQSQIATGNQTIQTLSNSLAECSSATLTLSNHLADSEAAVAQGAEHIANLNRQVTDLKSDNQTLQTQNQTLGRSVTDLTGQVIGYTNQIAADQAALLRANQDYLLLDNRFRRDVAERVVVERKFNNAPELQAQLAGLKQHPAREISAEKIYAELNVEVLSNGVAHVIAPN